MNTLTRIENQLRRGLEGEAWHGPAVFELLSGISPEQAHIQPVPGAHSIWEIVLHLAGAYRLVLRRLRGDRVPYTPEEDWPPVPEPSAEQWRKTCDELKNLNLEIRKSVLAFDVNLLDQPLVADVPYTAYTQFVGLTQHDLYHAGQIALLKRLLTRS